MKRSMCGLVLFAAAAGLWSCNGDPTGDFRTGETVIADPTSVFVDQGSSKFVTVEVVDSQGNQLSGNFEAQNVGAGITVEKDTTFLETSTGQPISTSARFVVTGVAPGATSFDVTSGGATTTVPVRVIPTSVTASLSNPAPAVNEPVTITLPAGFKFAVGAGASTDLGPAIVQSFSADSTAIVVLLPPGSTGVVTLDSVQAGFLPGVTLGGIPTDATVTADATPIAGTGATGTAPTVPVPTLGTSTAFFDVGTFTGADITGDGGLGAQYYKFIVTQAGDYTITTNWVGAADLDAIVCFDAACAGGAFAGSGTSQPEQGTLTLAAGTYYFAVVLFAGAAPPNFSAQISAVATPAP
jgi:hypothetical protein